MEAHDRAVNSPTDLQFVVLHCQFDKTFSSSTIRLSMSVDPVLSPVYAVLEKVLIKAKATTKPGKAPATNLERSLQDMVDRATAKQ